MVLHRPVELAGTIGMCPTAHKNTGWNAERGRAKINGIGNDLNPLPILVPAGVVDRRRYRSLGSRWPVGGIVRSNSAAHGLRQDARAHVR